MPRRLDKAEPPGSGPAGILMLLIAGAFAVFPEQRNWYFIAAAAVFGVVLIVVGSGRIYRPAVTRTADNIECRYAPWHEATFYLALIGMPLLGYMMIVGGAMSGRGSPSLWRIVGILVMVATPIPVFVFALQRRRSLVRITPLTLTVPVRAHRHVLTEIPRDRIQSITLTAGQLSNSANAPVTQITYQDQGSQQIVLFGPTGAKKTTWLTVEQADLLAALQSWKRSDRNDPALMDRTESILRGSASANTGSMSLPALYGRRWLIIAATGVLLVAAVAYSIYRDVHTKAHPEQAISSASGSAETGCAADGARTVTLSKRNAAEPSIYLPLTAGWAISDENNNPDLAADPDLRAYVSSAADHEDFTPYIQIDLTDAATTDSGDAIADELFTKASALMTVTNRSAATVCGSTVYRADTSGYNPDGNGPRSGTTLFTIVDGKGSERWIAILSIKTKDPDNPSYVVERDALVKGFHAGFP